MTICGDLCQEPCPKQMTKEAEKATPRHRLEVVADGLTLCHGAQLDIDTTLVSPLHREGNAR